MSEGIKYTEFANLPEILQAIKQADRYQVKRRTEPAGHPT